MKRQRGEAIKTRDTAQELSDRQTVHRRNGSTLCIVLVKVFSTVFSSLEPLVVFGC